MAMTIELPDSLDEELDALVDEGFYSSKAEVIRSALRSFLQEVDG